MLRFKGNIEEAKLIENYIIANTTHIGKGEGEDFSKAFIKQYNIYIHTEGNPDIQLLFDIIPATTIKLCYDYRNYTAEVKIDEYGFRLLSIELPELKRMIKEMKEYQPDYSRRVKCFVPIAVRK